MARVLVLPFAAVDGRDPDNVGQGVQAVLIADLARRRDLQPVSTESKGPTPPTFTEADADRAIELGRAQRAKFVICGSFQVWEGEVRLTGLVLDADRHQSIGGLKATGSLRDLFTLQDALAAQAARWMTRTDALTPPTGIDATAGRAVPSSGPIVDRSRPALAYPIERNDADARASLQRQRFDEGYAPFGDGGFYGYGYFGYSSYYGGGYVGGFRPVARPYDPLRNGPSRGDYVGGLPW